VISTAVEITPEGANVIDFSKGYGRRALRTG